MYKPNQIMVLDEHGHVCKTFDTVEDAYVYCNVEVSKQLGLRYTVCKVVATFTAEVSVNMDIG